MLDKFFAKFIVGEWNLGICNRRLPELMEDAKITGKLHLHVKWMKHRCRNSFFADPFVARITRNDAEVYAEEFLYTRQKGILSALKIDRHTGKLLQKKLLLEESCHLSYPYFDRTLGVMLPESYRNGVWAKYAVDMQTDKASFQAAVTDRGLIDATPLHYKDRWWVFAMTGSQPLSELHLFHTDSFGGPLQPHGQNPVKKDIASARPAGKFFEWQGELFRPVQNSTTRYGEALHIMKIKQLSETAFEEEFFCDVVIDNPSKYPLGVHTLNFEDDFIVVDGYRERFRPALTILTYKLLPLIRKIYDAFH